MSNSKIYANLKTGNGDPIREYIKENFDKVMNELEYRTVEKNDRTLYFVTKTTKINGINFYGGDYLEVKKQ